MKPLRTQEEQEEEEEKHVCVSRRREGLWMLPGRRKIKCDGREGEEGSKGLRIERKE